MRNFITGIGGFVASHLADYLLEKGEEVIGTFRWNEDLSRIAHIKDKITLIPADLTDLASMIKAMECKPDYIYHLAAESYVNDSYIRPHATFMANTIGTLNLLEAVRIVRDNNLDTILVDISDKPVEDCLGTCCKSPAFDPVVHVCSSSETYGMILEEDVPVKETQPFRPQNPYGASKCGADMIAYVYFKNYGIKTIRTRMFTHTGPRRTMLSAEVNFAKQIAEFEKQNNGECILKHGNLNSIRTFADVRDAVRAYYLLVRKCTPGEVYNIGGNDKRTIQEVLDYLLSLSKVDIKPTLDESLLRPSDITLQVPDSTKFIEETGWKPKYNFEQTMEDLLNWYRENV